MKKTPYLDILKSLLPSNEWEDFLESYNKPLPKNITIITHKGIKESEIHSHIDGLSRPGQHFLHQGGFFYIQEQAASLPAQVLLKDINLTSHDPRTEIILDMCAAPGGKSIQLADAGLPPVIASEAWQSSGNNFVVSNEPIDPRRKALIYNINRTGCCNTMVTSYDGTRIGTLFPETFDKVLIDAPCSGEGMNYKIAIQQSRDELKIKKIASLQYQLLKSGILACKQGGTIIYSTCTLNPIENEGVIADIMNEFSGKIELENIDIPNKSTGLDNWQGKRIIERNQASKLARFRPHKPESHPGQGSGVGGFFIAKIKKTIETPHGASAPFSKDTLHASHSASHFTPLTQTGFNTSPALQSEVRKHLDDDFGIEKNDEYFFLSTGNTIYLTSSTYQNLPDYLKNNAGKIGIPIYSIGNHIKKQNHSSRTATPDPRSVDWIPTHHLGNILGHLATKNVIELTDQQAQEYSDHKDIPTERNEPGFVILTWKKCGFSIGKIVDGRIKNKMI